MKKPCFFPCGLGLVAIALGLALVNGCNQREAPSPDQPSKSGVVSAEKTSFREVTSHLDAGGNFYLYLGTEQWLDGISGKVSSWRQIFSSIPDVKPDDRANINKAFDVVTGLIRESGVEDVSGVGVSSIAREKGLYQSKMMVHHYPGKGSGFLWTMFGQKPHPLTGLDLLPANTVMATFSDLDVPLLWSVIQKQVAQAGIPQAEAVLNQLPANFERITGVKWEQFLASLGGEFGFIITLDESKKITIPLPTSERLEISEPGLMFVAKVKDDTVFNRVDQLLKENPQVVRVDKAGLKMRTMALPIPLPIPLRPTLASSDGYLFLATSDVMMEEVLAVKGGQKPGLKSTDEFKRLTQGIPSQGNQFSFMSQRFGQSLMQVQRQALALSARGGAAQTGWLQSFLQPDQAIFSYVVSGNTDEGWLTVAHGNQNSAQTLAAAAAVAPVGLLAAIAIPNFVKARDTAQKNACINNLRQIDGAKHQWALEKRKPDTATPTPDEIRVYLRNDQFPICPGGGTYKINPVNEDPACSIAGHRLPQA